MYELNSYNKPFWAENSGFMTGRDPLGVQNSSITTYSRLLPGLTNLTLRLRYYGFYMWVLDSFFIKQGSNKDFTLKEQHNFIRRAELIISFIMHKKEPDEQSIIGSNFTIEHDQEINIKGYYDIALGADKLDDTKKGTVYWDYPSGALGQYYGGALSALNLISVDQKFFTIEPKGKELANAFRNSIKTETENHFLACINKGKLTFEDIEKLTPFKISDIKPETEEWFFYKDILLGNDGKDEVDSTKNLTSMRSETIELLLKYFSQDIENYSDRSFILHEYKKNAIQLQDKASLGWYYYYVNEAFHFAIESIFWGILIKLDGEPIQVHLFFEEFIADLNEEILKNGNYNLDNSIEEVLMSLETKTLDVALKDLESSINSSLQFANASILAFELIFQLYLEIVNQIDVLKDFEVNYRISGQKGRVSENFELYVSKHLSLDLKTYIRNTLKHLMNDHINTAYRKMGNGESNLLKFVIEDGIISHIQTMPPKHTSPRLKTITNFLLDLSLIDKNQTITDYGIKVLEKVV